MSILSNYYFNGIIHPIWSFREACGLYRRTKYIMLYAAILNLILSFILGFYFGIAGILFASLIARLSTYFWFEPKILFNEYFNQRQRKFYLPLLKNFVFTLVQLLLVRLLFSSFIASTWITLIFKAILVGCFSTCLTIVFYAREDEFKLIINRYLRKD